MDLHGSKPVPSDAVLGIHLEPLGVQAGDLGIGARRAESERVVEKKTQWDRLRAPSRHGRQQVGLSDGALVGLLLTPRARPLHIILLLQAGLQFPSVRQSRGEQMCPVAA